MGIAEDWQRVERWLAAQAPEVLTRLPTGASKTDLDDAGAAFGFALPQELLQSWAMHDGNFDTFSLCTSDNIPLGNLLIVTEFGVRGLWTGSQPTKRGRKRNPSPTPSLVKIAAACL